jgi:hypothetical protein
MANKSIQLKGNAAVALASFGSAVEVCLGAVWPAAGHKNEQQHQPGQHP